MPPVRYARWADKTRDKKTYLLKVFFAPLTVKLKHKLGLTSGAAKSIHPTTKRGGGIVGKTAGLKHIFHKKNCLADNLKHFRRLPILGDSLRLC